MLGLLFLEYRFRFKNDFAEPEDIVRSVILMSTLLVVGLLQAFMGLSLVLTQPKAKSRKSASRKIVVQTGD